MKKSLLLYLLFLVVYGCTSEKAQNEQTIKRAQDLIIAAGNSPEAETNIPFGLKLGWSGEEAKAHIDSLKQAGTILEENFPSFIYKHQNIRANVELFFVNNALCRIAFQYIYDKQHTQEYLDSYSTLLDYLYQDGSTALEYKIPIEGIKDEENWDEVNLSVIHNLVIEFKKLKYANSLEEENVFIFSNQPKAKMLPNYQTPKELAKGTNKTNEIKKEEAWREDNKAEIEQFKNQRTVQNSPYDDSVWQVEDYLKKNLKDPDSYKSIEWGKVTKTKDGEYSVRHKYRAKNSLGGYTIENIIFHIDITGNITSTIKTK